MYMIFNYMIMCFHSIPFDADLSNFVLNFQNLLTLFFPSKLWLHPGILKFIWQVYLYYYIQAQNNKITRSEPSLKVLNSIMNIFFDQIWSCIIIIMSIRWWPNDASRHHPRITGWCLKASSGSKGFSVLFPLPACILINVRCKLFIVWLHFDLWNIF